MANNLEVRLLPNGLPYICLPQTPQTPQTQQLPQPPQVPQLFQHSPLSQFSPITQQNPLVPNPFDQVFNPTGLPLPPPPGGLTLQNPYLELMTGQLPFIQTAFNPFLSLGPSQLPLIALPTLPVPLMSLRIPTPPTLRAHPYQMKKDNADSLLKRTRQRNNSLRSTTRMEKNGVQVVENRAMQFYQTSSQLGTGTRNEVDRSEKEEALRLYR